MIYSLLFAATALVALLHVSVGNSVDQSSHLWGVFILLHLAPAFGTWPLTWGTCKIKHRLKKQQQPKYNTYWTSKLQHKCMQVSFQSWTFHYRICLPGEETFAVIVDNQCELYLGGCFYSIHVEIHSLSLCLVHSHLYKIIAKLKLEV